MLNVGDKAPSFKVKNHLGEWVTLDGLKGKKVILWFYPKADTPGCTAEGCGFRDRQPKYNQKNAVILGVSFDSVEENRKFVEKFGFTFPLLCDTGRDLGVAYGACKSPQDEYASRIGYVIDENGKILRAYPKVDAKTFPETALGDI